MNAGRRKKPRAATITTLADTTTSEQSVITDEIKAAKNRKLPKLEAHKDA